MSKILVTGADGFIGSHLVEYLVAQGKNVRAFTFYNSQNSWGWLDESSEKVRKSIEVVSGDIRDEHFVRQSVQGCDTVLHLAALIGIPYSYHSPGSYVSTNIQGTLNVLQAARDFGVKKVIHTSTSEVYGTARFVPITEEHPLNGQSPYSATKIGADQLALSFFQSFATPVTVVRPFNTYGPRQSARAVIPTIISQIAAGAKEVHLGALSPTRDFNYVGDIVRGFAAAVASKADGEVVNLSSNYEVSVSAVAEVLQELMNKKVKITSDEERVRPKASEVERLWGDNQKAAKLLNWRPEFSGVEGLKRGLKTTIDWFTVPENLRRYKTGSYTI